jgi:hypothetical protein
VKDLTRVPERHGPNVLEELVSLTSRHGALYTDFDALLLELLESDPTMTSDFLLGVLRLGDLIQDSRTGRRLSAPTLLAVLTQPALDLRHAFLVTTQFSDLEYAPGTEAAAKVLELAALSPLAAVVLAFRLLVDDQYQYSDLDRANLESVADLEPARGRALARRLSYLLASRSWFERPSEEFALLLDAAREA